MRKVQVRIENRYIVSFNGVELKGSFKEVNQMAGMKLLVNEDKEQIVLDFPPDSGLNGILADVLGNEVMEANIVKASPHLFAGIKPSVKKEITNAGRTGTERADGEGQRELCVDGAGIVDSDNVSGDDGAQSRQVPSERGSGERTGQTSSSTTIRSRRV